MLHSEKIIIKNYPRVPKQLDERLWGNRIVTEFLKCHPTAYQLKKGKEREVPFRCDTLKKPQHHLRVIPTKMWASYCEETMIVLVLD